MNEKYGTKWSRDETILAMELYCRTPFSKIGKDNPEIVELAKLIGRTPSSVGLKMANIAHFDPGIRKQNLSGMGNASKLDEEIFKEFHENMLLLSNEVDRIKAGLVSSVAEDTLINNYGGYDSVSAHKNRIGQTRFREYVLASYNSHCCITGLAEKKLLLASHIKPWSDCDDATEKTNPCNGLCLNPWHDRAFDKGFITIDKNYKVIVSEQLNKCDMDDNTRAWLREYENKQIILPDKFAPGRRFIEYHNDVVFLG